VRKTQFFPALLRTAVEVGYALAYSIRGPAHRAGLCDVCSALVDTSVISVLVTGISAAFVQFGCSKPYAK